MKTFYLYKWLWFIGILLGCFDAFVFSANNGLPDNTDTETKYLSLQASLIPMFSTNYFTSENFPLNLLNPDAKQYIRFYLEKDNSSNLSAGRGILLLGYIGNHEDILFVDNYLQSYLKTSDQKKIRELPNLSGVTGCFAGMMIRRGIEGAKAFFERYANIEAWMFLNNEETTPDNLTYSKQTYSSFIMGAYQYSKADYILPYLRQKSTDNTPFLHESFVDALEKLKSDQYTENMRPSPVSEETLNECAKQS